MSKEANTPNVLNQSGRDINPELDRLESKLAELKVQYEQYFLDIATQPPDKLFEEVSKLVRQLQNAPFMNSVTRFRLRTLTSRFQTYKTYWERVKKDRENGRYARDIYKAKLRTKSPSGEH